MKAVSPSILFAILFCYSFAVAAQNHIFISMFLLPFFLLCLNFKELKNVFKKLIFLNIFVLFIILTLLFEKKTDLALLIFARSNLIILSALLLFLNKNEFDIALAMQQLKLPKKLVSVVFFTAKYIFLIRHEFTLFRKTLYIRGFKLKTNFLSYRVLAGFVGILAIKAWDRAKNLQKVMILRNFDGEIYDLDSAQTISLYDALFCIIALISLFRFGAII